MRTVKRGDDHQRNEGDVADTRRFTIARAVGAVGCTLILSLAASTIASTQARSGAEQQIAALQAQLAALDRRVKELEKTASNASGPDDATPAGRIKSLEDAVRKLEAGQQSQATMQPGASGQNGMRLTAPLTVTDRSGRVLMRVAEQDSKFSRGAYLYDEGEKVVGYIGGDAKGGRVYATRNGQLPQALLYAQSDSGNGLILKGPSKTAVTIDTDSLTFFSDGGNPLSLFGTKDRLKGYMELNDGSGAKMIEAGMLNSHVGYVLANPSRSSVGINGNPSVLMGGAGR
jgi:hypothetical protein